MNFCFIFIVYPMADIATSTPPTEMPGSSHNSNTISPNRRRKYPRPQSAKITAQANRSESQGIAGTSDASPGQASTSSSAKRHGKDPSRPSGRNPARRRRKPPVESGSAPIVDTTMTDAIPASVSVPGPKEGSRRKANFGASLTKPEEAEISNPPSKQAERRGKGKQRLPQAEDLTSSLIRELSTPPFLDCPICFSSLRPEQPIWSCSPSLPIVASSEAQIRQYCWTSFHLKCIRSWAEKSVKEVADAWRARGELNKIGDWRCPGCQAKREIIPSSYWYGL